MATPFSFLLETITLYILLYISMEERKYTGPYLYYISSKSNSSSYARVCYYHNLTYEQRLSPTPWILRKGTAEDYQLTAAHLP